MDLGLKEKVAFIAGSSRGIGLAIAKSFLNEGAHVIVTGRSAAALNEAAASLQASAESQTVLPIQADLTNQEEVESAFKKALSRFDGIDAVIANVGSGAARGGFDLTADDWDEALKVNLLGSMMLARLALAHLVARGHGTLTFVSSIAGYEAINAPVTYSAAKAAVLSAMKNLSRLAGPSGVRVNAVAPGNTIFPGGSWERKLSERRDFFEKYIQSEVALRRFGRPEEIADAVVYLSSERASFITGACLIVDGGQIRSF